MELRASDRVLLRTYYNDIFELNMSEITYCEELIKNIVQEEILRSYAKTYQ